MTKSELFNKYLIAPEATHTSTETIIHHDKYHLVDLDTLNVIIIGTELNCLEKLLSIAPSSIFLKKIIKNLKTH